MKTKVSLFGFLKCGVLNRALLFLFCAALPNVQSIAFEHVYLEKYNPNEKIEFYCNTSFETPYYGEWFVFIKAGFQNECYGPVYKVNDGAEKDAYWVKIDLLSNTYSGNLSTVDKVELICKNGEEVKSRSLCFLNVTTTWKCGDLGSMSKCEGKTGDITTTAPSNGTSVPIIYEFNTMLDWGYPICDCDNWKASAVGADGKTYATKSMGCSLWGGQSFGSYSWSTNFSLPPNSETNPSYEVTGYLTSTHTLRDGTPDESIKCTPTKVIINDPPTAPQPTSPTSEKEYIYYRKSRGFYPTLVWKEPASWGWISTGVTHEYVVNVDGNEKSIVSDFAKVEYQWEGDLQSSGKTHKWKVGARSSSEQKIVWSDEKRFQGCPVGDISAFSHLKPKENSVMTNSAVEFQWKAAGWNSESCANKSLYGYTVTAWKKNNKGVLVVNKDVGMGETSLSVTLADEDEYSWRVQAYGPAGVKTESISEWSFSVCLNRKPGAMNDVRIDGDKEIVCSNGTMVNVGLVWSGVSDSGQACSAEGGNTTFWYSLSLDGVNVANPSTNGHSLGILCNESNYKVDVKACNGYGCGDGADASFSICAQVAPDAPGVSDHTAESHCRRSTTVSWSHSGVWGNPCTPTRDAFAKKFVLTFRQDGASDDVVVTVDGENGRESYYADVELAAGTWSLSIVAVAGDGVESSPSGPVSVVAAEFHAATGLSNGNTEGQVEFAWEIDERTKGCAGGDGVQTTLYYIVGDSSEELNKTLQGVDKTSCDVPGISGQIQWWVELSNRKGEVVSSEVAVYSTDNDCHPIVPRWAAGEEEDILLEPADGAVLFGPVLFRWKAVETFGQACKDEDSGEDDSDDSDDEGDNGINRVNLRSYSKRAQTDPSAPCNYIVNVNGKEYKVESTHTSHILSSLSHGPISWNVVSRNGGMTTQTESRTFCLENDLPSVNIRCDGSIQTGLVLEWEAAEYHIVCGETPRYIVEINGEEKSVPVEQTNYSLPEYYEGRNITWGVRLAVDAGEGPATACNASVCVIKRPNAVRLHEPAYVSKDGRWTFEWDNTNTYGDMCGVATNYTYTYSLRHASSEAPVCGGAGNSTSFVCDVGASGAYTLSVVVDDGISNSTAAVRNVTLCIPASVSAPNVTGPANGTAYLDGELVTITWEGLTRKESQCNAAVNHSVRYWVEGEGEETAAVEALEDGDTYVKLGNLAKNKTYQWVLEERYEHWAPSVHAGSFRTCTVVVPPVPAFAEHEVEVGESFSLEWEGVEFGDVCGRQEEVGYYVYFSRAGSEPTGVPHVFVNVSRYDANYVADGEYQVVVRAVNNGVVGELSDVVNVSVCVTTEPKSPVLWSPLPGTAVRVRGGTNFDVVKGDHGKVCGDEASGHGVFRLCIDGQPCVNLTEDDGNMVSSYGRAVYRFAGVEVASYGLKQWQVEYVRPDGHVTSAAKSSFFSCDVPLAATSIKPADKATGVRPLVDFEWEPNDFGERCTEAFVELPSVQLYVDLVNFTEAMAEQNVTSAGAVNLSAIVPSTMVYRHVIGETSKYRHTCGVLGGTYVWRTVASNGYDSASSPTRSFTVTAAFCETTNCSGHGVCVEAEGACACHEGFNGTECEVAVPKPGGSNSAVLGGAIGGSLGGVVLIVLAVVLVLVLLARKSRRKRVVLEGPGSDIRFSRVKVPAAGRPSSEEAAAIEQQVREDCERLRGGAEPADAFVFARKYRHKIVSDSIDETVKAILYAYYKFGCGRELLKFYISKEVDKALKPETLFRLNSTATVAFKFWSKIVGLDYLFACFSDVLKGIIQHEVDAENDRKSSISMQLFNDTCEVDPLRIEDDEDADQLLAVNATQLSLTAQRFATQIFRSIGNMPYEIKDVCCHINETIERGYPGYGVRGVSAFLFLRFYCVSITVPEVYGLLKEPPSPELRRTFVLATKILQVLSLGIVFDNKEQYMKQFNVLIEENRERMNKFYETLLNRDKPCKEPEPDVKVPSNVYKDSLLLMAFMMKNGKQEESDDDDEENESKVSKTKGKYQSVKSDSEGENEQECENVLGVDDGKIENVVNEKNTSESEGNEEENNVKDNCGDVKKHKKHKHARKGSSKKSKSKSMSRSKSRSYNDNEDEA